MALTSETYEYIKLAGPYGAVLSKLSDDCIADIEGIVADVIQNQNLYSPANENLVGHIEKEFYFDAPESLNATLQKMVLAHHSQSPYLQKIADTVGFEAVLKLHDCWVNFQKKHDYNPPHNHSGVFSFVIWHKIPYDIEAELRINATESKKGSASTFNFLYHVGDGIDRYRIEVDKNMENYICFFPANLHHYVNPFYTSDEFRISISGNLRFYPKA